MRNLERLIGLDDEWALRLKMKEKERRFGDAGGGGLKNGEGGYGEKKKRNSHR
ncbi:hypothetical protein TSUD_138130 [Trifolium subterraneum]|uniref:Uncharacterized protein n=1 Tax=Trifolium subterraneum TaxID=3900 RepID=A0A2Z6P0U5_TRISU|nr:hypothetical protein TSUD_138130 [Trifolium subterraneum]